MTSDQWVALVGQIGVGGVALIGMAWLFAKVVVPMASARATEIVTALRELTAEIKQIRTATTAEHADVTERGRDLGVLGDIGARISRLEGIFDHDRPRREGAVELAGGSRDLGAATSAAAAALPRRR